jgi:hypothetical protein
MPFSLGLGVIVAIMNGMMMDTDGKRDTLLFLSLISMLIFAIQQTFLLAVDAPSLPGQIPLTVSYGLTALSLFAALITASIGAGSNGIGSYWILYLVILMFVASVSMIGARYYATGTSPTPPDHPQAPVPSTYGRPGERASFIDGTDAPEPEPQPVDNLILKVAEGVRMWSTELPQLAAPSVAWLLTPTSGGYMVRPATVAQNGLYEPVGPGVPTNLGNCECGAPIKHSSRFCQSCGKKLEAPNWPGSM